MRKRLVIAAIAAVAIGVAAYLHSQPKKGTLEYHKREYLEAHALGRVDKLIDAHAPQALQDAYWGRKWKQTDFHRQVLLEKGFLEEKVFVISNRPAGAASYVLYKTAPYVFTNRSEPGFNRMMVGWNSMITMVGTNTIHISARPSDMQKWQKLIREADVIDAN